MAEQLIRVGQGRPKTLLIVGLGVATILGAAVLTVPVYADPRPTLAEVQQRVDELHEQASEANERFRGAEETLEDIERSLTAAERDAKRQAARVKTLTAEMGGFAAATYRAGGLDPTVQAMFAEDPDDFLARSAVIDAFATQQTQQLDAVAAERRQLEEKRLIVEEERSRQAAIKAVLTAEKKEVDSLLAEQEELLATLTAEEKARLAREREKARLAALAERDAASERISRGSSDASSTPAPNVPTSDRAAIAVKAALSKIGYQYVYGGTGPDVFDCSGFTSWAWAQAGVSLSHSSQVQATQGTRVSVSQLQPGDILFYDSPVSHVAMYIGDGMVVHASNPTTDVTTAPMYQAGGSAKPFAGAMRPG